ncbi:MAG: hypothetical protein JW829_16655 [Pirellulales bacterium]|nr:hypothetical protein [Pirellulales bacterium]
MIPGFFANLILAQVVPLPGHDRGPVTTQAETELEFARPHQFDDERWFWVSLVAVGLCIVVYVWSIYRRDRVELKPVVGYVLILLRLVAFAALGLFFLKPTMRTDQRLVRDSRVVLLADVSQSMGLADRDPSAQESADSRQDRFGSPRNGDESRQEPKNSPRGNETVDARSRSQQIVEALSAGPFINRLRKQHEVVISRFAESVERIVSFPPVPAGTAAAGRNGTGKISSIQNNPSHPGGILLPGPDWLEELAPRGTETRIGDAIRDVIQSHRLEPLAGIILLSDGGQNAGIQPDSATELASEAAVPIYAIGVGSPMIHRNVRIADFVAPSRAYPGDAITLSAFVQSAGFRGRLVNMELRRRNAAETDSVYVPIASERIALGTDSEMTPVVFKVAEEETGHFIYEVRVIPPAEDISPGDNFQEVDVEITNRQLHVLLFADGATREYRFLRNQFQRDTGVVVDVILQSSPPGISQDADRLLSEFPRTPEELGDYDCIVAFDPDWMVFDADQFELLETWIAEEAGSLILIAGPVHSSAWIESAEHHILVDLHPVVFRRGLSLIGDGRYGSETPCPLEFTREGRQAEFLQLAETPAENKAIWSRFEGVFGHFAVKGSKPGAVTYATLPDPESGLRAEPPVYMARQFYGAGRVFFMGSGEMWRLRKLDESYFEMFYTKLLRHMTQGRLLRGKVQGALLIEQDRYHLGDTVVVRAQLRDTRHEPLITGSLDMHISRPDHSTQTEKLIATTEQPGNYVGQFRVLQEGTFNVTVLTDPGMTQSISKRIQVRLPDLERQQPELNQKLLSTIAQKTGGLYYDSLDTAIHGSDNLQPLADKLRSRAEVEIIRGAPDREFEHHLMFWLLGIFCGAICLEWFIRRFSRLA